MSVFRVYLQKQIHEDDESDDEDYVWKGAVFGVFYIYETCFTLNILRFC